MIQTIYIEHEVKDHPLEILRRFPKAETISIERYGEVFNRKNQNFRLQKIKPALILARKHDGRVLTTPPDTASVERPITTFHLYNCVYDCRYCFLQGMYRSANYVLFVNYEEFWMILTSCRRIPMKRCISFPDMIATRWH